MTIELELIEQAAEIATQMQSLVRPHHAEIAEILARKAELEAELEAIAVSPARLAAFLPLRDGEFQCPNCWMYSGIRSSLKQIDSLVDDEELYRCDVCHEEYPVPI